MRYLLEHFGEIAAFAGVALMVLSSAAAAAFSRNIVHAAYALFFTLLGMAGFYFLLGADFLGIVQVIVYVGGILVLLLFGVLLTSRSVQQLLIRARRQYFLAVMAGLGVFVVLCIAIAIGGWKATAPQIPAETTRQIGRLLLTKYLLAFEFSSITLLAALIGAAHLVRGREE